MTEQPNPQAADAAAADAYRRSYAEDQARQASADTGINVTADQWLAGQGPNWQPPRPEATPQPIAEPEMPAERVVANYDDIPVEPNANGNYDFEPYFEEVQRRDRQASAQNMTREELNDNALRHANRARRGSPNVTDPNSALGQYVEENRTFAGEFIDELHRRNNLSDEARAADRLLANRYMSGEGDEITPPERTTGVPEVLARDEEFAALSETLDNARAAYIQLMAHRRGTNGLRGKKALDQARQAYETARDNAGQHVGARLRTAGADDRTINTFSHAGAVEEIHTFETELLQARLDMAQGSKMKRFYDWWARQGGGEKFFSKSRLLGSFKKSAVTSAVALPFGVAAGIASATLLGPVLGVAGVAAAGSMARSVARNLAAGRMSKGAEATRVATAQARSNQALAFNGLGSVDAMTNTFSTADLTKNFEAATQNEVDRNRRRTVGALAIGVASAGVGAIAGGYIGDHFMNRPNGLSGGGGGGAAEAAAAGTTGTPEVSLPKLAATDARLPWQHFADKYSAGEATPKIMSLVEKARGLNIGIEGNGQGGGQGAITRIVMPDGKIVPGSDLAQINAVLDLVDAA